MLIIFFVMITYKNVLGQSWMPGYNFRKKILINKAMIGPGANLLDFPLLIELEDHDLKQSTGCMYGNQNSKELDISFASVAQSSVPINFQLDSYDALTGKLICWVRIKELIATGNAGQNELYLYYGSKQTHHPGSAESNATWSNAYKNVWHVNPDIAPATSRSANQSLGNDMIGDSGMSLGNFARGKIGSGVRFNGLTSMHTAGDTSANLYVTLWLKLDQIGSEQVILANDTLGGGFRIAVDAEGFVVFSSKFIRKSIKALTPNNWYYLAIIYNNHQNEIYINGAYSGGDAALNLPLKNVGMFNIGKSKQNDQYFKGMIDELRMLRVARPAEWLAMEYKNQLNPTTFFNISSQETNPLQTPLVNEFTGANGTNNWADEANWSYGKLPEPYANVSIKAGKELRIPAGVPVVVNGLILNPGARLLLGSDLEVNCSTEIGLSSSIVLDEGIQLTFKNDVLNNGSIALSENTGILTFSGDQPLQAFSGSGSCSISRLEVNLVLGTLLLQATVKVSKQVALIKGILNANGNLTLLSKGPIDYAALLPIQNTSVTNVVGNVTVQQFIDGDFLAPSTARNWWLLSSPVYQSFAEPKSYKLDAVQQSIFVTGVGGISNGFDFSPNNNPTIYTHDQSLPGSLSQKYVGIPTMGTNVLIGKGFYVFSRGSRTEPDAYLHQVERAPFSNPKPYVLNYSGKLFNGELRVSLQNRNAAEQGDGYNLLGNPYASPLIWGALQKVNVSPFIWVFDPKNNAYRVTDEADYVIHSGTGFFVKVSSGNRTGELTFTEQAKSVATIPTFSKGSLSTAKQIRTTQYDKKTKLKISLNKDGLSDDYILTLHPSGNNEIDDADAAKIGEGYLSISGLAPNGDKLSIDDRAVDTGRRVINLFVKGWTTGDYTLKFNTVFNNQEKLNLIDHYLDVQHPIAAGESIHKFSIDTKVEQSYGKERFSLLLEPLKMTNPVNAVTDRPFLFYPNPVNELIYLKAVNQTWKNVKILIRSISGEIMWRNELIVLEAGIPVPLFCGQLIKGIYVLQLIDQKSNKTITSFKILKN